MRRITILTSILLLTLAFMLTTGYVLAQDGDDEPPTTHTVQTGENLFRIAQDYGVSVQALANANGITDPNNITVGQVLIIPAGGQAASQSQAAANPAETEEASDTAIQPATQAVTQAPAPASTEEAQEVQLHLVRDGENLYTIAGRYGVTVVSLAELNGITDYNLVRIGQRLRIPSETSPLAPPRPPDTATPAPEITPVNTSTASAVGFAFGVDISSTDGSAAAMAQELGVEWVKLHVNWAVYEEEAGTIDFDALDAMVTPYDAAGLNILLTVTAAPDWARTDINAIGPPDDFNKYAEFLSALTEHFAGVVDAIEVWSEPNLSINWVGKRLGATSYMDLLKLAYNAIKTEDPAVVVVTAGLAPTATNDGVLSIDDRVFLRGMYAAGAADFSDAIGAHPLGWANPPDSLCCQNNRPSVPAWDDQPAFFFLNTMRDYRNIMRDNDEGGTFIWVTSAGWGSFEGFEGDLRPDFGYVTYTDADEQAQYTARAFQLAEDLTYIGPMFVSNLDACDALGEDRVECYWSLIAPDGSLRPVFATIQSLTQ